MALAFLSKMDAKPNQQRGTKETDFPYSFSNEFKKEEVIMKKQIKYISAGMLAGMLLCGGGAASLQPYDGNACMSGGCYSER